MLDLSIIIFISTSILSTSFLYDKTNSLNSLCFSIIKSNLYSNHKVQIFSKKTDLVSL